MLKEKLMEDLKESMKNKDVIRKNTVQMVRAAILQIEKDKGIEVEDDKILEIIAKLNKFELAIGNETDLLCKHYYKLGIVDSKKILMEIGE